MYGTEWIRCPVCGSKTRDKIREDTVLKNYPLNQEILNHEKKRTHCRRGFKWRWFSIF
ncbi:MAG: hypothetical protein HFH82_12720 [Lachnospiraceae bacterium]|nr:hypothetical protein [Lachnospiraceae bacterium]